MQEITYKPSLVAFIDILGFKNIILNTAASDLGNLRSHFKFAKFVGDIGKEKTWGMEGYYGKMFSDSVTMTLPVEGTNLYAFLYQILHFQAELANRGIFLRGAAVTGDHYEDTEVLFGPALIQAVELEKTVSLWPRIIVHNDLLRLADNPESWLVPKEPLRKVINSFLQHDSDGISYLNYLGFFPGEIDPGDAEMFLKNHQTHIINNANENKGNLRVLTKYHWLANYHNHEMAKIKRPDLRINLAKCFPEFH